MTPMKLMLERSHCVDFGKYELIGFDRVSNSPLLYDGTRMHTLNEVQQAAVESGDGEAYTASQVSLMWESLRRSHLLEKWGVNTGVVDIDVSRADKSIEIETKSMDGIKYGCLMVEIQKSLAEEILRYGRDVVRDEDLAEDGRENWPHITVKYGFKSDDPEPPLRAAWEYGRPTFRIVGVTRFQKEEYDVIVLEVDSEDIVELNQIVSEQDVIKNEYEFKPHITLAYVKPGSIVGMSEWVFGNVETSDTYVYSSSEGQKVFLVCED